MEKRILDSMRDGGSELAHDRTPAEGMRPTAQILEFRPRERLGGPAGIGGLSANGLESELLDDLAQYEQDRDEDETVNYPRRMLMNVIAAVVVTVLIGVGVLLADTIGNMERDQDCILQGRQNCALIEIAAPMQR